MTTLLILGVLALIALLVTVHDLSVGGRGVAPPPASHRVDPDSVPPTQRLAR